MNRVSKPFGVAVAALACVGLIGGSARAEDTKGKWQFGFGLSYYATTDYIRSNSDIAIASSVAGSGGGGLPPVTSVDDRPDENMLNEPTIQDDFRLDFSASYGLTRWFALELQTGYLNSAVGQIEYYNEDKTHPLSPSTEIRNTQLGNSLVQVCGPNRSGTCYSFQDGTFSSERSNEFVAVGEITEVPLMLSGLFRFRPESPLDPYVGFGIGYIFTDMAVSDEFNQKSDEVQSRIVNNASYGEVTDQGHPNRTVPAPGYQPGPMTVEVEDGFEYHMVGGIDYFVNDRFSMYVDARYVWAESQIDVRIDGAHQVRMPAFDDGRLQAFTVGSAGAPNLWEDNGINGCPTCVQDGLIATEDSNGNRTLDPALGEGSGLLYLYPAGPNPNNSTGTWSAAQAVGVIDCSAPGATCAAIIGNGALDSEDLNLNGYLDRYLSWGVDVCSMAGSETNPLCAGVAPAVEPRYVWPIGCGTNLSQATEQNRLAEGCPPIPPSTTDRTYTLSGSDDESDIYLIQGGKINLGGFSIGMGMKFTF